MARKKIETIVLEKIHPYTLNDVGCSRISRLVRQYSYELLLECIDIGVMKYFRYDANGKLTKDSADEFLNKLGGIAHNKSRSPVDQEIVYLINKGKAKFQYWNPNDADKLLHEYVKELMVQGWSETMVLNDLRGDVTRIMNNSRNWSQWSGEISACMEDIKKWREFDSVYVEQMGTILPEVLFEDLPTNIQMLCKQINASYENNLFDCSAVIMRRLLESLLVLSYQNLGIECEIMDSNGKHHKTLDKMIKNAEQNTKLALSANTKKDLDLFKDLGNYSAHKIWYNCTQQDIKPHILKYRAIIEELMYKAGIRV